MELEKNYILFLVIASTLVVVIMIGIAIDLVLLYRRKKIAAEQEKYAHQLEVDQLLQRHEMESVNALLRGQDEERIRIAQELHDSLGSILFTAKLHYSQLEKQMRSLKEQQNTSYSQVTNLLDEAVDEVRRISHDLYEGSLAKFGYKTALLQLIHAIETTNTIRITFDNGEVDGEKYVSIQRDLYRITQELLSNTLKYADALSIHIKLRYTENLFQFEYHDDGVGFSHSIIDHTEGIGFRNIQARAKAIGGKVEFESTPGSGMTCTLKILNTE